MRIGFVQIVEDPNTLIAIDQCDVGLVNEILRVAGIRVNQTPVGMC
jgi:hypothetical protein